MAMTRLELIEHHKKLCTEANALLAKKNADYGDSAGDGSAGDCFGNLRLCEQMGVCSMEEGIVIRMGDKIRRTANMLKRPAQTKESILDNVLDIINYAVLLHAALEHGGDAVSPTPQGVP